MPAGHALGHYVEDLLDALSSSAQAICLSDPTTAHHIAAQVMERFAAGAQAVSLGMDDGLYDLACASDSVLAAGLWDKNFMSPALTDPFMALYNNVAELTQVRFPDRRIGFLAYSNITLPPQRHTVAAEPLVAYLAPIDVCPIHGMDDPACPPSQEYRDVMYRWSQTMQGRLIIYDYDQSMLVWRDIPNPSIQAIRQDIQHYRAAGILGVDTESRGAMATTFLNLYLRSRLYWIPMWTSKPCWKSSIPASSDQPPRPCAPIGRPSTALGNRLRPTSTNSCWPPQCTRRNWCKCWPPASPRPKP